MDEKEKLKNLRQRAKKFNLRIVKNKGVNADFYFICDTIKDLVIYSGENSIAHH